MSGEMLTEERLKELAKDPTKWLTMCVVELVENAVDACIRSLLEGADTARCGHSPHAARALSLHGHRASGQRRIASWGTLNGRQFY